MESSLLRAENLNKVYRTDTVETTAVANVTLEVNRGDFAILCGPSGCGKSTLLSMLAMIEPPTSGSIHYLGNVISPKQEKLRAQLRADALGIVFQSFNLVPELTALENVALGLSFSRSVTRRRAAELAEQALKTVGLESRLAHYPNQMSGGQQQRVAIARAIVGDRKLLLADEPTGNLDSANASAVIDLFDAIHASGVAICMVTHDPRYLSHGNRVIEMKDGKLHRTI